MSGPMAVTLLFVNWYGKSWTPPPLQLLMPASGVLLLLEPIGEAMPAPSSNRISCIAPIVGWMEAMQLISGSSAAAVAG